MTRRDAACLLWGDDFYGHELVLPMSYEQMGVFQRLLWISWKNVGLPDDPRVLAQLLGLPRPGLSVRKFLASVWPAIAPCWTSDGAGRLFNKRQEEERARRASSRGDREPEDTEEAAADDQESRRAKCRASANIRWQRDRERRQNGDATHANRIGSHHANAHATHGAIADASHAPPAPPSEGGSEANQPSEGARAHANRNATSHANDANAAGAGASHEEQSGAEICEEAEVREVAAAFEALPHFRTLTPARFRSGSILEMSRHAVRLQGFKLPYVAILDQLDAERAASGKVGRGSSLGTWMKEGTWCDEIGRRKDRGLRIHSRDAPARPTSEPLLAKSLVDGAVQKLLGGA